MSEVDSGQVSLLIDCPGDKLITILMDPHLKALLHIILVPTSGHKLCYYRLCCLLLSLIDCCVSVRMAGALRHPGQLPVGCRYSVCQLDLHLLLQEVS